MLYTHREALQDHLFGAAKSLFGFADIVTLYDLTNTCFEGIAAGVGKAARGRSKEKRTDCPLVTLAVVLDGSGFVRRSRVFAGNASEPQTLQQMLAGQHRITTTLQRRDGRAVHVRKATRPEPRQKKILDILRLPANPGGTQRVVV